MKGSPEAEGPVLPAEEGRSGKVQGRHQERFAVVYVRQSTVQQVQRHQESTRIQYGLVEVAVRLGWPRERVLVIDEDLGISGASAEGRAGFQRLLGEVALDHVGLILGVEMSRLARSCKDWYQLLELCAIFGTLIGDLDGLYDPSRYNDRLLLGLKGTMSEAELHILKQRMLQGKMAKARRGELWTRVPVGYVRRPAGDVAKDPDEEAQAVVERIFEMFERQGTLDAVLRHLVKEGVRVGVREDHGPDKGSLAWRRPSRPTLRHILHNPIYAGAYVYGRCRTDPRWKKAGRASAGRREVPMDQWEVCLRDRVPAYITWEQYERNRAQLAANRSRAGSPGVPRAGAALLSGLLRCGRCGAKMVTQYTGRDHRPRYACVAGRTCYGTPACQGLRALPLDTEMERLVLRALEPAALELSLAVREDLEKERARTEEQWQRRLERTRYEADRAARQYRAVEPENRLVARTLEQSWEELLRAQRTMKEDYERSVREQPRTLTAKERDAVEALAADIPALWEAPTTTAADRKAIVRLLVEEVGVTVEGDSEWVEVVVRWAGGRTTYRRIRRPVRRLRQLSNCEELLARALALKAEGLRSPAIAARLNAEGWHPAKRRETFSVEMVQRLLLRLGPKQARRPRTRPAGLRSGEWLLADLARELKMPVMTLHTWVYRGWVRGRREEGPAGRWILTAGKAERERLQALRSRKRCWPGSTPEEARLCVPLLEESETTT